jgi:hypothetical protein
MATIRVSSNSQLASALRSAGSGDTISLSSGTYSLSVRGENVSGAVIKAASGANVTFSHVSLRDVQNLTFDGVNFVGKTSGKLFQVAASSNITVHDASFSGNGSGIGFWVNQSDGITLEDNTFKNFRTGTWIGSINDLDVRDNTLSNIHYDGMIIGKVHHATVSGNSVSLNVLPGTAEAKHTDGIQFYNTNGNDPMTDVMVQNNRIQTNNTISHGIFAGNGIAEDNGRVSTFYKDVTFDNNTIVNAQLAGIAVGQTVGLRITNNIVLQDPAHRSSADVRTPAIRVEQHSDDVTITGNVVHRTPGPSTVNWQLTNKSEPGWTISNNKVVSTGTSVKTAENLAPNAGASDAVKAAGAASAPSSPESSGDASVATDGHSDTFRFFGDKAVKGSSHVEGLDFGAGDTLVLTHFDAGTFRGHADSNYLAAALGGDYVKIDSLADLRELNSASPNVSVHTSGDTLILDIAQKGQADHVIEIAGIGHAYGGLI